MQSHGEKGKKNARGGNVIKFSDTGYEETLIMNECIRQRMHFLCKMCMTRKQIEESA